MEAISSDTQMASMLQYQFDVSVSFLLNEDERWFLQARSQTLKNGGANNYYKQGLIQSFLKGNNMQGISNIGGS